MRTNVWDESRDFSNLREVRNIIGWEVRIVLQEISEIVVDNGPTKFRTYLQGKVVYFQTYGICSKT